MKVCVVGASGFVGGELLRLLLQHSGVEVVCATSRKFKGEYVYRVHPNLRGVTQLKFVEPSIDAALKADVVFLALPHGESVKWVPKLYESGAAVFDLSADFRLKDPNAYVQWYRWPQPHPYPDLLQKAVYGQPELHRHELPGAKLVAVPGCMATASILMLAPLAKHGVIGNTPPVVDAKIGSSGAGAEGSFVDLHSFRTYVVRPYEPVHHRHIAEIEQELSLLAGRSVKVAFTPHAVDIVRGIFTTGHVYTDKTPTEADMWKYYRSMYSDSKFIRLVKDRLGVSRYPNVKYILGSNYVDIGFEIDPRLGRVVTFAAIDNLVRGAAGQAVQAFNIAMGFPEDEGLRTIPIAPI
ncbi:N-acetyl-gamma-glutamyl-phosphate reductase [Pyrobaculum sp. 3827-6]|uniref:N-acetyl-gamma-glutamyl-phosphate reductase n=1 Tax=Pyrobaculum sp. 3827-6 TaxID=2983604 RepID=UPI0021D8C0E2|nr:N-acetyl-gamma-glutamyl-phosphate reductase [Pyrobaculum sp. 3827-6]MCU7787517.1 N-acetyl-gamma-glutamyl-phosphate reductase [Pyrobaculum sp. 3827-6]